MYREIETVFHSVFSERERNVASFKFRNDASKAKSQHD